MILTCRQRFQIALVIVATMRKAATLSALATHIQHRPGWVECGEAPTGKAFRQMSDLRPRTGAHAKNPRIGRQAAEQGIEQQIQRLANRCHPCPLPVVACRLLVEQRLDFLVTHGERDRQIALDYAHQSYEALGNSPRRELKVFTEREGGVEHVGADNMSYGRDYIADWFADTLGGHSA